MSKKIIAQQIEKIKTMGAYELAHFESVVGASLLGEKDKEELYDAIKDRKKIVCQGSDVQVEFSEVELD